MPRNKEQALKLIQALRKAADSLQSGTEYAWSTSKVCNCGHLAKALLDPCIYDSMPRHAGQWSEVVEYFDDIPDEYNPEVENNWGGEGGICSATRIELKNVVKILLLNGMEAQDFHHLEFLSDEKVLERAGVKTGEKYRHYVHRENVIKYMLAWADMLCEEQCALKEISNA